MGSRGQTAGERFPFLGGSQGRPAAREGSAGDHPSARSCEVGSRRETEKQAQSLLGGSEGRVAARRVSRPPRGYLASVSECSIPANKPGFCAKPGFCPPRVSVSLALGHWTCT